jgi:hypothetical protein
VVALPLALAFGVTCYISGLSGLAEQTLAGPGVLARLEAGNICRDRKTALQKALGELAGEKTG